MIPVVTALKPIRKMRAGSRSNLILCDDGRSYVVKLCTNPMGARTLVDEVIATSLMQHLGLNTADIAFVRLGHAFLEDHPAIGTDVNSGCRVLPAALNFGSLFPSDPSREVVYDSLPDSLLPTIHNRSEFLGILAFDKWMAKTDGRQAVFVHAGKRQPQASLRDEASRNAFRAIWVDHGHIFNGSAWVHLDLPLSGLHFSRAPYQEPVRWADFEPWLGRIMSFSEDVVRSAVN